MLYYINMNNLTTPIAILISGILISLVIASKSFAPRYSIVADAGVKGAFIRLDNKTGETCVVYHSDLANCYK